MRLVRLVLVLVLAVLAVPLAAAAPAQAATPGYVRLAHLSPDTPEVDVYLTSFSGTTKVFPAVGYATVSAYQPLAAGRYTVAMRMPGAAADSDPVVSMTVRVVARAAYTVAGVGPRSDLSLKVLTDDLSRPASGTARMRVVQAASSAGTVDVRTDTGRSIATGVRFPSTTGYTEVPAQRWTLEAEGAGGSPQASTSVDVRSGSIYTVLVLDRRQGSGLRLDVVADAAGTGRVPTGGVDAGGSGLPSPWLPVAGLLALAALRVALPRRHAVHA